LPGYEANAGRITCHGNAYTCASGHFLMAGICTPCADFCITSDVLPGSCNPTTTIDASASAVPVMFDRNPLCGMVDVALLDSMLDGLGSGDVMEPMWLAPIIVKHNKSPPSVSPPLLLESPPPALKSPPPITPSPPQKGNESVTMTLVFSVDSNAYNATLLKATLLARFTMFANTVEVTLGALVLSGARHLLAAGSVTTTVVLTGADAAAVRTYANSAAFLSACATAGVTFVTVTVTPSGGPTSPLPPGASSSTAGKKDDALLGLLALLVIPVGGAGYFGYYKMQQSRKGQAATSSSTLGDVLVVAPEEPPEAAEEPLVEAAAVVEDEAKTA
jgi:hypothetical protein